MLALGFSGEELEAEARAGQGRKARITWEIVGQNHTCPFPFVGNGPPSNAHYSCLGHYALDILPPEAHEGLTG